MPELLASETHPNETETAFRPNHERHVKINSESPSLRLRWVSRKATGGTHMRIGYARVSSDGQSPDLQLDALKKAGRKRVFTDKASTTKVDRPGLVEAISQFRSGDMLVIWKPDRLGRTVKGLVDFVADLQDCGVQFRSLTDGIDTTTPAGRFFFTSWVRWRRWSGSCWPSGLVPAWPRRRGRLGGRKRRMTPGKVESARKLLRSGMSPRTWRRTSASRSRCCIARCPHRVDEPSGPGCNLNNRPDEDRCFFLRCYRNPAFIRHARIPVRLRRLSG